MIKVLPFVLSLFLFFLIKLSGLGIRLSDSNSYWYVAYLLSQGKFLYKDVYFSNFPLFAYISLFYYFLTGGKLLFFYLIPAIEVIIVSSLIYYLTYKETKTHLLSLTGSLLYLFSFIILSTSDHQTGVFIASLFAVLSFLFYQKKKLILSGVFIALALLTKAYFLPVFIALTASIFLKKNYLREKIHFFLSFCLTFFIILTPFLLISSSKFFNGLINYSMSRPAGLSKTEIAWFFLSHDPVLFLLLIFNFLNMRKNLFFGVLSITGVLFFILYSDIYYLYLNFLIPFLSISLPNLIFWLNQKFRFQIALLLSIISIFLIINLIIYLSSYQKLQKVESINQVNKTILKEKPSSLYGVGDITPALLYLTNTKPLENVFDPHPHGFDLNIYNREYLTKKAISQKTIVIVHGAFYPEFGIKENLIDNIFNKEEINKSCKLLLSEPVQSEGLINRLNLFKCY